MLEADNVRQGFFEPAQLDAVCAELPEPIRPVATFAYLTGWRTNSEVLPLTWRQVNSAAGRVRLEPGTTKNKKGREFPFTRELRALLEAQRYAIVSSGDLDDAARRLDGAAVTATVTETVTASPLQAHQASRKRIVTS